MAYSVIEMIMKQFVAFALLLAALAPAVFNLTQKGKELTGTAKAAAKAK